MQITLYKNSQHEASSKKLLFKDQWAVSPYEAPDMFCSGETTEQKVFVLPPGVTFNNGIFCHDKTPCVLSTNGKGKPVLTVSYMSPFILLTPEEKKLLLAKAKAWVPGYDKNGELEIF